MHKQFKKTALWITDYAHMLKGVAVMYLKHTPPKHYLGYVAKGKPPIIILPGVFLRWAFLKPLADYLSLKGHPVYIVPKLGHNTSDIPSSAAKVKEILLENDLKNVILVAHSKGGLIGKYLLVNENAGSRVKGLIAIASPFSGSAIGRLVPHYSVKELTPENKLIRNLSEHKAVNQKIISIIPDYDNHIWHEQGSFLEGALANIRMPISGHHKILSGKRVWEEVVKGITKLHNL